MDARSAGVRLASPPPNTLAGLIRSYAFAFEVGSPWSSNQDAKKMGFRLSFPGTSCGRGSALEL
jgi:hypothetical protein